MAHNNVIDFTKHFKDNKNSKTKNEVRVDPALVVDMTAKRSDKIQNERREVRRTILTEFIGTFVVTPRVGLHKVSLYDISENGLAFDISEELGNFKRNEKIAMRVYLNHKTYFSFMVNLKNMQYIKDEGVTRHGGEFIKGTMNDEALHHLVKFIETVSASLKTDHGDVMVSNLAK